jgi:hypothetical protein
VIAAFAQLPGQAAKYLTKNTDLEIQMESNKKRRDEQQQRQGYDGRETGPAGAMVVLNSGIWGGLFAMLCAALWGYGAWVEGRVHIFPPLLFVLGLFAIVKGLMGTNE